VQDGKLFMLQTRNGKRTGPAALKIAIDLEAEVRGAVGVLGGGTQLFGGWACKLCTAGVHYSM
jgi:hypothetical protein